MEDIFQKINEDTPNRGQRGATGCPGGHPARPHPWPRREGAWTHGATPGSPLGLYIAHILNRESFRSYAAAPWRKPTEKKRHLRRADSAGENTSQKGRSSPSSSPSSHASSRSSSPSSPTSSPSPSSPISSHNFNLCCNPYYPSSLL